jgi:argininosuccinate lyase
LGEPTAPSRLWGGRHAGGPAEELDRINRSLPLDWRLWPFEIEVDRAWVDELVAIGRLRSADGQRLHEGLDLVERRLAEAVPGDEPDEDIHSLIERWLEEVVGDVASQVRLGRSRNDVVATDSRMWTMASCREMVERVRALQKAIVDTAAGCLDVAFPGYSHLQPAQPTRAAHWLLAHFWPLERGRERMRDAGRRVARLPLGAAAGMGSTFPVDRERLAARLGFHSACENSLDAVGSRDWVAEIVYVWAQIGNDLARLAEDLIVYSSSEFGLVRLADEYTTGSSLMPQKRNPDGAELARARGGALIGLLAGLLATLKGLPSGYNKDLQEDKRVLFTAESWLSDALDVLAGIVRTLEVVRDDNRRLDPSLLATDLAEYLAAQGMPFRQAHELVGRLVVRSEELGTSIHELAVGERTAIDDGLDGIPEEFWSLESSIERRAAAGGSALAQVRAQLEDARARLEAIAPDRPA